MNGVHDMGGMHGLGEIPDDDAAFHADWERTAYVTNKLLRLQGHYNIHEYRHSVERMDPADYLAVSYFERWFTAVETLARENGLVAEEEIERRMAAIRSGEYDPADATPKADAATDTLGELADRATEAFQAGAEAPPEPDDPRFEPGDDVRVRNVHPAGHTRAPRYTRGAVGTVQAITGAFELPDARAHGKEATEPVYDVRFDAAELWGPDTDADTVDIEMWESYLTEPQS